MSLLQQSATPDHASLRSEVPDPIGADTQSPPHGRAPVHDPRQHASESLPENIWALAVDELWQRYLECVRHFNLEQMRRVEQNQPPITTLDSPKLILARQLYAAWQAKVLPFRSQRQLSAG